MRPGGRVDNGVSAIHDLELLVAPVRALGSFVRAVPGRDGLLCERLGGVAGVEDELDHLPVALVQVVEVVEDVEEPVLQSEPAGMRGVGGDVGVDGRHAAPRQPVRPALVVAPRAQRIAREVQVVLEQVDEIAGGRPDLHEVDGVPRTAQGDGRLLEQQVDVDRLVRLAVAASLGLGDETHDRRMTLRERRLVGEIGRGRRRPAERRSGERDEDQEATQGSHEADSPRPGVALRRTDAPR